MPRSTVVYGFADAAQQYPQHPAVLGAGPPTSYAALAAAAGGYAELLTGSGVRPGDRVGLLTLHGGQTIAAILGTLAAGAGYVPLDPAFPVSRLARMVGDAGVGTLLCDPAHEGLAGRLRPAGGRLLPAGEVPPRPLRPVPVDAGALAYVLFTSGSTGRPKAVGQTHRNLLHVVRNQIAALAPGPADRLSLLASFSFDAAIPDLYPALLTGAAVVPVDLRSLGLSEAIDELSRQSVTIYHSTPTVYRHLLAALCGRRLPAVRTVLLGGEQATYEDVRRGAQRFAPDCVFVNGYGSTEVTFAAQYQIRAGQLPPGRTGPLPIGAALPGFQLTVAEGTGELHVRSRYLAPGYLNQDSDRFTVDPDGTPRYRTGDLGTAGPEGTLVCLGRLDRQVKVRGVRVEPAEVEAVLAGLPGVGAVRVIVRDGDLLGYACPAGSASLDGPRLRTALAGQLPEQLVPRAIIVLPGLPLTVTGKVDELALPPPAGSELGQPAPDGVARTPTERAVHDLWCAVLGAERVDRSASFFDAGGDSLRLGQVQAGLADRLGVRVGMADLLAYPTIAALAGRLDRTPPAGPAAGNPAGTGQPSTANQPRTDPVARDEAARDEAARDELARAQTGDEIAVVGLAGRFPGATDLAGFWWNLCAGVDGITDFTDAQLDALGIGPRLRADPGHVRAGGFLPGVDEFDAEFFSFGADEAARTDPQHRLFLEAAWAALEDAGHDPAGFPGLVGVFSATSVNRYHLFHLMDNPAVVGEPDPDDWEARLVARQFTDHLPGQVAYRLGLTGPAVAIQSACSSSLVAVCLAAQSLVDYRCDLALAGGATVSWPRYRYTPGGLASPDGRCRAFDVAASGSGFSSGVGVVALRRLADAQADRDHIYAVLPGWSVTNDGAVRAGYAVPGPAGQAAALAGALAHAQVAPHQVGFVEAHGSGTPLGDAIEVAALNEVYAGLPAGSCALGSVKTNIGHLDAAAGIAGLIKTVLAVHHGVIPPNLHFTRAHPEVNLAGGPFQVPTKPRQWPDARRLAGVSSFGVGGTNAHVLVEQAPPAGTVAGSSRARVAHQRPGQSGGHLLPVSARTPQALRAALVRLRAALPAAELEDVGYTLALGRRHFTQRAAVAGTDLAGILDALDHLLQTGSAVAGTPGPLLDRAVAWVGGEDLDWAALAPAGRRVPLPGYPFQRRRYWIDPPDRARRR